ncbi:MAG: VanZ family protein [Saprospiraceae bacterium]|uniref:VanZ family protein n=1 Tax=Candidatus Opimibacter skivensis TaxID=2982028 RepID=A0A9D7STY7_9BACT|nr:VanZ family protein [Candidatus Opimibacter skivensis]
MDTSTSMGVLIAILSLIPGGPGNFNFLGIPYFDKVGHCGMYAVWAFLIFNAFAGNPGWSLRKAFWSTVILGTCVGVGLEFVQNMMALGRQFEILDMAANACGAFAGTLLGKLFFQLRLKGK